jgi:hypothetical protein
MGLQAVVVLTAHDVALVALGCVLLVAGVWLQLLQRFVFRLRLGYLDSYFRVIGARSLRPEHSNPLEPLHDLDLVSDFVLLFVRLVGMVILGYAAVYSALHRIAPGAFGDLGEGIMADLSLIYFSVATIATVGYGDIVPKTLAARALVTSEILAGFALLVLLITSFSLTASPPRAPDKRIGS